MRLFVWIFIVLFSFNVQANVETVPEQKILKQFEDGFLEEIDGLPVLHLKGTPYEMGYQYGYLAGDRIVHGLTIIDGFVKTNKYVQKISVWLVRIVRKFIGGVFWWWFDKDVKDEIKGIVKGAKAAGHKIKRNDLAFINSVVDIAGILKPLFSVVDFDPDKAANVEGQILRKLGLPSFNCDTMAVWGSRTVGGKTFQTRNIDLNTGHGFEDIPLVVIYKPEGGVPYMGAVYAGVSGIYTGMNAYGVGLGQVWAFSKKTGMTNPWPLQLKSIFSKATSAHDAVVMFSQEKKWTYGSNFVFADAFGDGYAVEVNKKRFVTFTDNDPKEDLAMWNDFQYSIPLKEAVFRGDIAMDVELRANQTASNGPNGDPRSSKAYNERYKGQADRIIAYEEQGVKIGHLQAEAISRETAMRDTSLQAAVYANSDRLMWVSYAKFLEDGSVQQAYDGKYQLVPFAEYLASLNMDEDGRIWVSGDEWIPQASRHESEYEVVVKRNGGEAFYSEEINLEEGDVVYLRLIETGYIVDVMEI